MSIVRRPSTKARRSRCETLPAFAHHSTNEFRAARYVIYQSDYLSAPYDPALDVSRRKSRPPPRPGNQVTDFTELYALGSAL